MTLRQFYLLLAEYYELERVQDARFYKLYSVHFKEPPPQGDVFPLLKERTRRSEFDDDLSLQYVTKELARNGDVLLS